MFKNVINIAILIHYSQLLVNVVFLECLHFFQNFLSQLDNS